MIFCFSGTGNSRYIAQRIAEALQEPVIDLNARIKANDTTTVDTGSDIIMVTSTYAWRIPKVVSEWMAEMLGLMVNDPNIEAEELSKITVPTLVICGTKDMIKESHTKEIVKGIPNSKLAMIEGSHFVANENSEIFNQVVENWLSGV